MIIQHGPSQYEDSVMTARGLTFEPQDDNIPIDIHAGQVSVGNFQTGSTQQTVSVTVPSDTEPGKYQIPIKYTYSHTRHISYDASGQDEGADSTRTETGSITIRVKEDARFEVVETNATAQIGDDSDISMAIRNTGSEVAKGSSVTAESKSSSLTFESGDTSSTTYVGDWQPGEVRNVTYNVKLESDAIIRGYTVDLAVGYNDIDGISHTSEPLPTVVQSTPEQSFAFKDISSSLRVGENGQITGAIKNTGPNPVKSVSVHPAENLSSIVPSEESVVVGSLAPSESRAFRLPIEVTSEGEPGEKLIGLNVQYRDGDGDRKIFDKRDISAAVGPSRDAFKLAFSDKTITVGSSRTLSVEVTNNLNQTVTDIDARMFADDPLNTGKTDTSYIKSLEPGESTTVKFDVSASSAATAENTYPVSFDFRYTDRRGNTHLSDTFRYPLNAVQSTGGSGPPLALIGGVIIVVLGGAAVVYRRYN
nr:CARDB domain-containing protein [Halarchaeum grantii]